MNLAELSGSPLPNGLAVVATVLLVLAAFAMRAPTLVCWGFIPPAMAFGLAVISKNLWYYFTISEPKAENDSAARAGYADALLWITIGQLVCAVGLAVMGLMQRPSSQLSARRARTLRWLSGTAALAAAYAAVCTLDWRHVYLTADATKPVSYEMYGPSLHWVLVAALTVAIIVTAISLVRRREDRWQRAH
jgi:heme/copper-type cytochrome/quinol oxidase subunit 3